MIVLFILSADLDPKFIVVVLSQFSLWYLTFLAYLFNFVLETVPNIYPSFIESNIIFISLQYITAFVFGSCYIIAMFADGMYILNRNLKTLLFCLLLIYYVYYRILFDYTYLDGYLDEIKIPVLYAGSVCRSTVLSSVANLAVFYITLFIYTLLFHPNAFLLINNRVNFEIIQVD